MRGLEVSADFVGDDLVRQHVWLKLPIAQYLELAGHNNHEVKQPLSVEVALEGPTVKDPEVAEEDSTSEGEFDYVTVSQGNESRQQNQKTLEPGRRVHVQDQRIQPNRKVHDPEGSPVITRDEIWRQCLPPRLLLHPKYWTRGFSTRLKPPSITSLNDETKTMISDSGHFYRLARPNPFFKSSRLPCYPLVSWFCPERDYLYYPYPADKVTGVHTVTQNVVMENIANFHPKELPKLLRPLMNPEIFASLKTIHQASGLLCADEKWSPSMVEAFFGSEYLIIVNLLDRVASGRVEQKLLDLLDVNDSRYYEFKQKSSCFDTMTHWDESKFVFEEAWLNAKWKLPYTRIIWPDKQCFEEIVPTALLEDPRTRESFKGAVVDASEDFRTLDADGFWDRTSPYVSGILYHMPELQPVFVFVRPENLGSLWQRSGAGKGADELDLDWYDEIIEMHSEGECVVQ
ncbi:hypothetical protein BKA67DRAFT_86815 [Truncatella angustata]|uniref:Uncharacterized protein n=1 Tax=Truncatella angustata TaxID=152316 RepID=A0A9P8RGX5_9PEZI|nr:uncharacterized protein BKA67DRAFT_86815 [Truncatella angustata]KAH6645818.1 hypothetical protein BKA67DRAFT_86815 [Truncatella angustata]KAH8202012.1 hypothetical protein TruAng_003855 [Truncatella angustata]